VRSDSEGTGQGKDVLRGRIECAQQSIQQCGTRENKKVAASARFTRSGERGTEAAPATSERYVPSLIGIGSESDRQVSWGGALTPHQHSRRRI